MNHTNLKNKLLLKATSIIVMGAFLFNTVLVDLGWAKERKLLSRVRPPEVRTSVAEVKTAFAIPQTAPTGDVSYVRTSPITIPILQTWEQAKDIMSNAPLVNYDDIKAVEDPNDIPLYAGRFEKDAKDIFEEVLITKAISTGGLHPGIVWAEGLSAPVFYAIRYWEWSPERIGIIFELSGEKARNLYGIDYHGAYPKLHVQLYDITRAWLVRLENQEDFNQGKAQMVEIAIPGMKKTTDIILKGDYPITRKAKEVMLALELEINRIAHLFEPVMRDFAQPYPYHDPFQESKGAKSRIPEHIYSLLEEAQRLMETIMTDLQIDKNSSKQQYVSYDVKKTTKVLKDIWAKIPRDTSIKRERRRRLLTSDSGPITRSIEVMEIFYESLQKAEDTESKTSPATILPTPIPPIEMMRQLGYDIRTSPSEVWDKA